MRNREREAVREGEYETVRERGTEKEREKRKKTMRWIESTFKIPSMPKTIKSAHCPLILEREERNRWNSESDRDT